MPNPTRFTWVDPTTNTDGTAITAGEVTGYEIGIRVTAGSVAGIYPIIATVPGATAASELLTALGTVLVPGSYAAAIRSSGPIASAWSAETTFTIVPPTPSAPTNFLAV